VRTTSAAAKELGVDRANCVLIRWIGQEQSGAHHIGGRTAQLLDSADNQLTAACGLSCCIPYRCRAVSLYRTGACHDYPIANPNRTRKSKLLFIRRA